MRSRVAVVGVGHMGRFHARKLRELAGSGEAELAGVADLDRGRAVEVGREVGAPVLPDLGAVAREADAAVVAVPTASHHAVVRALLLEGLDVLVEKPLAATPEEGEELLELARSRGRILQVGHLERFNSAVRALRDRIDGPRFVEAHRMGPFPERATDIDVVRDLMIHDLDLIQEILGEEPSEIEAIGVAVLTHEVDIANARLRFPSGCVANLTASRVSPSTMRKIRFFQPTGYFSLDLLSQSATILSRSRRPGGDRPEIALSRLDLSPEDALRLELESFLRSVRDRSAPPVSGEQALRALRTALRVTEAMPPLGELP